MVADPPDPARLIIVSFLYSDDDGSESFIEFVYATAAQEETIRTRLENLTKEYGHPPISDLYVGPPQTEPSSFEDLMRSLDENPYIAAAEAALVIEDTADLIEARNAAFLAKSRGERRIPWESLRNELDDDD